MTSPAGSLVSLLSGAFPGLSGSQLWGQVSPWPWLACALHGGRGPPSIPLQGHRRWDRGSHIYSRKGLVELPQPCGFSVMAASQHKAGSSRRKPAACPNLWPMQRAAATLALAAVTLLTALAVTAPLYNLAPFSCKVGILLRAASRVGFINRPSRQRESREKSL